MSNIANYVHLSTPSWVQSVDRKLEDVVAGHHLIVSALVVFLSIALIWSFMRRESFNPTATLRQQVQSLSGSEALANGSPSVANMTSAQVLASSDFNCAAVTGVENDAWAWMNKAAAAPDPDANAKESMAGGRRPQNDNDYSKILAGQ